MSYTNFKNKLDPDSYPQAVHKDLRNLDTRMARAETTLEFMQQGQNRLEKKVDEGFSKLSDELSSTRSLINEIKGEITRFNVKLSFVITVGVSVINFLYDKFFK